MPHQVKPVTVQVFAVPSTSCKSGETWEAATDFLRQRLQYRFGRAVEVEHVEMFTARSFEFPDVLAALQHDGGLPVVRVEGKVVSHGEKLSESRIAAAITALLESDRRQS